MRHDDSFQELRKILLGARKNVLLKNHTTFKIGGPADYFLIARKKEDLLKALRVAKNLKLNTFVLGGGSNLLVSDKGFSGLVIKIKNQELKIKNNIITADAGIELGRVVKLSINKSLKGLEWAGGLPGTLGGAVRGNAGAFGGEIKDSILKVGAIDNNLKLKKLSKKQCRFSYRSSIFKEKNWTVFSVSLKLREGVKKDLKAIANSNIRYRKEKHPLGYPNSGSIFKNVPLEKFSLKFKKELSKIIKKDPFEVVPVAYLISQTNLKGLKVGGAQVSEKHPNFIINKKRAKAADVLKLIDLVKKKIKDKYNIELEVEVQLVGF